MNQSRMEKTYSPQAIEKDIYEAWENSGAFTAQRVAGKKPFTIVMPPPNITGQLHMGHALDCVLQDALTRFHRMLGDPTLWLPGTDHASIATEVKIVEKLEAEGLSKQDVGREEFLRHAWAWKEEYGGRITRQLRRLGASCDWRRERFTMDEGCSRAVREMFVRLYEKGLIYRGDRVINWCPVCATALSDAEVEYEEQHAHLWHIRYPAADGGPGLVVATTRPETMLGDTAVAVNPGDQRYAALVGKNVVLPLKNIEIPVVADDYVDMEFGTGAVKITPAHDPNDFEVAKRHNLPILRVTNDDGSMNEHAGERYQGLSSAACRQLVVEDLTAQGLLVKAEPYDHNVGVCYRCSTTVEPLISRQWFVSMAPLAKPAIEAVRNGDTVFIPERFVRTYFNWMENIRDWCISRQLWWGHRIPAWHCDDCDEITVSRGDPDACSACGSSRIRQDEDVLDTWFSSALWPFSTLGWPDDTEDLRYFYPTTTLVTGYDIIFFWVARMIFSGIEVMGETPFKQVLIHGLVRDAQGRKMSKSLNNGIDPLDIVDEFGADALRFSLCMGVSPGGDMRFSSEKAESARNFANKIWNAARFVLMNLSDDGASLDGLSLQQSDQWILTRCMHAVQDITEHFHKCDLGLAAQKLYDFAWSEFCDWYIELAKSDLFDGTPDRKRTAQAVLRYVLSALLKMLHPFMPFITEALYENLPGNEGKSCMLSAWPAFDKTLVHEKGEAQMQGIMEVIRAVRNLRAELKVQPGHKARLMLRPEAGWEEVLREAEPFFLRLAGASSLTIVYDTDDLPPKLVTAVCPAAEVMIPLGDLVDLDKERARLMKERDNTASEIARAQGKLANQGFLNKAPAALVEAERAKLEELERMLVKLDERLAGLAD